MEDKKQRFQSEPPAELRVTGTIPSAIKMSDSGGEIKNTSGRKFRIRTNKDMTTIEKRPSFANSMTPQISSKTQKDEDESSNVSPNIDNRALRPMNILKDLPELRKNKTLIPIQATSFIQKKMDVMPKTLYNPADYEKDKQLISFFFRTKYSSLLSAIGKKDYILAIWKNVQGNKHELNYKIPFRLDFDTKTNLVKSVYLSFFLIFLTECLIISSPYSKVNLREDLISRLKKIVNTKSKYRYKEKIDFSKSLVLKSLNCRTIYHLKLNYIHTHLLKKKYR